MRRTILHFLKKPSSPSSWHDRSIYDICQEVYKQCKRVDIFMCSSAIAYSFFFSLFPIIILLFMLLAFFQESIFSYLSENMEYDKVIREEINSIFPKGADSTIFKAMDYITEKPPFQWLSFGFVMTLLFSSNGMITLINSFEKQSHQEFHSQEGNAQLFSKQTHSYQFLSSRIFIKRLKAILLMLILLFLFVISIITILLGNHILEWLLNYFDMDGLIRYGLQGVRWGVICTICYTSISIIYYIGTPARQRLPFFNIGTFFTSFFCILSSIAFSFYTDRFGSYNLFYGSFGAVIITMLWLQINAFILLVGFQLNVSKRG